MSQRLSDPFWKWAHRKVARRAQEAYNRDPKYQSNYAAGVAAGRSKWENATREREDLSPLSETAA